MAEKKFFVDINLQGNALTNAKVGTNSAIGSTEGAFGYDSASHRLQYFDGTATKNVANLTDIATVTGGLIFQGGYDPTTDTPDITDGSALKGFFWVATAAGTFLGEAVQVGDSIVAKIDAAGTTLSDWLILQGNVVIATDSVDGISRLATQTEANTGTEAGAVVITPATLQGKIDAQITPEISSKLPLAGGSMQGDINMDSSRVYGLPIPTDLSDATTKEYVDNIGNSKLSVTGGSMSGNIIMDNASIEDAVSITTSELGAPTGVLILTSDISGDDTKKIINLPAPTNGGDAANKTYVDDNTNNKLPLAGGTMSGNIDMGTNNLDNVGNLYVDTLNGISGSNILLGGQIDAQQHRIVNLNEPNLGGDAATKYYVDTADALKLDLAGGTMSGNINMDGNQIQGASFVEGNTLVTNAIDNLTGPITVYGDWDYGNYPHIKNLGTPVQDGDAANKEYVDTTVAAQSFTGTILGSYDGSQWVLENGVYTATITHNFNTLATVITTKYNGQLADFFCDSNLNTVTLYSNIEPSESTLVSIVKANGNL